jgi:hypothetical protein
MRENDFSQAVIRHDELHKVLSAEGITHWLGHRSKEDIISILEVRIAEVINFEPEGTCVYLKAGSTVDAAREVFTSDIGKRLFSALVTEHGNPKEHPINILTPWDLVAGALQ